MSDPDSDILGADELFDKPGDWEIRVSIYRNGRKIATADRLGGDFEFAVQSVGTALERRDVEMHVPKPRRRRELER
ncbi:hypothetical protein HBE99_04410 [Mycobacteroides chelonae]|uniref:hypothetical protein n=1 Tax=Mycobacteroides chelonae TaxID=1774 RepID=UPI00191056E6|nr:hypothetical protein [Mycobacteroides chelonae]QQG96190.1 hypothetical protein HBE99_04410 [Mycobacteroides chelonae]